ncbi:integrin alpha [Acidobacteriota bacterium]
MMVVKRESRKLAVPLFLLLLSALFAASPASAQYTPMILESNAAQSNYGWAVAPAGDVNQDGYADLLVGAPGYTDGQAKEGSAFLYLGGPPNFPLGGPPTDPPAPAWMYQSNQAGAAFGASVAPAGDVNGDGFPDVIIGAPGYDNGEVNEGRAYIFLGGPYGLNAEPFWINEGNQDGACYGASVASSVPFGLSTVPNVFIPNPVKSFNNDAYADIVVAAPGYDNGQIDEGRVFVYHGGPSGPAVWPSWIFESDQEGARLGASVAPAGWLTTSRQTSLIIGAPYFDSTAPEQGRAYLFLGTDSGLASAPAWTKDGDGEFAFFGETVGTAGDVNGDGIWDLLVGAWSYINPDNQDEILGRTYLFLGIPEGAQQDPQWMHGAFQSDSHYGFAVTTAGFSGTDVFWDVAVAEPMHDVEKGRIQVFYGDTEPLLGPAWDQEGDQPDALFGYALSTAGDLNGDGRFDLAVGAPAYSNGQDKEGAVYLYFMSGS